MSPFTLTLQHLYFQFADSALLQEDLTRDFTGAMLVVSHDEAFVQAIRPTHVLSWNPLGWQLDTV